MKPRSNFHLFAIVLCVLALFVAQTFGSKGGYVCVCGGKAVPTQTSHCHGPHGEKCHSDEAKTGGLHNDEDSGDRKDHEVVSHDVQARPVEAAPQLIAPQVLLAILPMAAMFFATQESKVPASYSVDIGGSPPFGVTVARTIVLLI